MHEVPTVFEVDDYPRDGARCIDALDRFRAINPRFVGTVFAIPAAMRPEHWGPLVARREWLRVGMHGFEHIKGECCLQSSVILSARLAYHDDPRFSRVFRAPHFGMSPHMVCVLWEAGWVVSIRELADITGIPQQLRERWSLRVGLNVANAGRVVYLQRPGVYANLHRHTGRGNVTDITRRVRMYRQRVRDASGFVFTEEVATCPCA